MEITNYDFLDEIYREYQHPWLPFEIREGNPVLQEFYSNYDNFPTIERKLRNIARAYYYELAKEADDFEFTMRPRAKKLSKYWNFIRRIWDDWFLNQGADGQPEYIHNYMHVLYYGTLDCVAVLCFAYAKKKLLFDMSSFDHLDTAMMGKRLSRYELCDEYTFAGLIERLQWFGDESTHTKEASESVSHEMSESTSNENRVEYSQIVKHSAYEILTSNSIAQRLLDLLVDKGYCNPDGKYTWNNLNHNNYERAVAANVIGERAGIKNFNKLFEELWNCKYMSSDFARAGNLTRETSAQAVRDVIRLLREA